MKHLLVLLGLTTLGFSATIRVNDDRDLVLNDGKCTLREAVENANANSRIHLDCRGGDGDDVIVFDASLHATVLYLSSPLSINLNGGNLVIDGERRRITISNGTGEVFSLDGAGVLVVKNLNLTYGESKKGKGSLVKVGQGQVFKLYNSFVGFHNASEEGGSVIYNDGGGVEVVNSTFSQNRGVVFFNKAGIVKASFITGKDNAGTFFKTEAGTIQVKDAIFDHDGSLCDGRVSVVGVVYATSNAGCKDVARKTTRELAFGSLDYHGGSTLSYAIATTSVAIAKSPQCTDISGNVITHDQRGVKRKTHKQGCDLGAYEVVFSLTNHKLLSNQDWLADYEKSEDLANMKDLERDGKTSSLLSSMVGMGGAFLTAFVWRRLAMSIRI